VACWRKLQLRQPWRRRVVQWDGVGAIFEGNCSMVSGSGGGGYGISASGRSGRITRRWVRSDMPEIPACPALPGAARNPGPVRRIQKHRGPEMAGALADAVWDEDVTGAHG